jgi:transcriptional regulator with XRE-family HTH domain
MLKKFGQLLAQKRKEAQLSIPELSTITGVNEDHLVAWEQGEGESPNFDMCYKIGMAISSRSGQGFVLQDLWQALRADKIQGDQLRELYFVN